MSNDPEERNRDSRKAAEHNIEQSHPLDKRDRNEPVRAGTEVGQAKAKGGKSAVANKVRDPARDLDAEYKKEKFKERAD